MLSVSLLVSNRPFIVIFWGAKSSIWIFNCTPNPHIVQGSAVLISK